ncbi:MAG: hypothetical protein AAFZ15_14410 [Bacteroidota bacterium]
MKYRTNPLFSYFIFTILCSALILCSCSKDDDADLNNQTCRMTLAGTVSDRLTGDLIDAVRVYITPVILVGQPNPTGANPWVEDHTNMGSYEFDLQCDTENMYILGVTDNEKDRYFFHTSRILIGDTDRSQDIQLCPTTFLKVNGTNINMSDSLVYRFEGIECDEATTPFAFSSVHLSLSDYSTDFHKLPFSSEMTCRIKSYRQKILQKDTSFVFSAAQGDTTEVHIQY